MIILIYKFLHCKSVSFEDMLGVYTLVQDGKGLLVQNVFGVKGVCFWCKSIGDVEAFLVKEPSELSSNGK